MYLWFRFKPELLATILTGPQTAGCKNEYIA